MKLITMQSNADPWFHMIRSHLESEILLAAIKYSKLLEQFEGQPLSFDELREKLGLNERPATVFLTALRAMGVLQANASGEFELTASYLEFFQTGDDGHSLVGGYHLLAGELFPDLAAGAERMWKRLQEDKPVELRGGIAFNAAGNLASGMDDEASAKFFTMALAGRARTLAPDLGPKLPINDEDALFLDVGGGSGFFTVGAIQDRPKLRGQVLDQKHTVAVAEKKLAGFDCFDRITFTSGNMFEALPKAKYIFLANVIHDWDKPDIVKLFKLCKEALLPGGKIFVLDVFLNDDFSGPLDLALYSFALCFISHGRVYSAGEVKQMLSEAGLQPEESLIQTLVDCQVITATHG